MTQSTTPRAVTLKRAPGPRGLPILGSLSEMGGDMIGFLLESWRRYGDIVRYTAGPMTMHLVAHPDFVKHVFVDNEKNYIKGFAFRKVRMALGEGLFGTDGSHWKRQRQLLQPPFTPRGVNRFGPAMTAAIAALLASWEGACRRGEALDINQEMMAFAMGVIGRTALSMDIGREARDAAQAFGFILDYVSRHSVALIDLPTYIPTADNRRLGEALRTLDVFIDKTLTDRQADPNPPDDLLSTLLNARDADTGEPMSRKQIRDEVLTIFFAGHETTAQALTWSWHLLSQHPEQERRLQEEADRVLAGRLPGAEDAPNLPYARMVVDESMRLYPPVWVSAREVVADDTIGGYHIPKGSLVAISQYVTHRHPAFWAAPDRFDPERFSEARSAGRARFAYFPFGGGPRICLGNSFALLEATMALAAIAARYSLRPVPGQDIRPRMVGTLRPSRPVMMTLQPR